MFLRICLHFRRFTAIGADIFRGSGVAVDKRIPDRRSCAEFNRNSYADILGNREHARAVALAITGDFSGHNHGCSAAFGKGSPCFGKRAHRYGHTNGNRLIPNRGTSLIFRNHHIRFQFRFPLSIHWNSTLYSNQGILVTATNAASHASDKSKNWMPPCYEGGSLCLLAQQDKRNFHLFCQRGMMTFKSCRIRCQKRLFVGICANRNVIPQQISLISSVAKIPFF